MGCKVTTLLCSVYLLIIANVICSINVASAQQSASCTLLLRGNGPKQLGVVAAELNCTASSPVIVSINTTYIAQYAASFNGVQITSSQDCQRSLRRMSLAEWAQPLPPVHALLHFCYNGSLALQATVENVWLEQSDDANSWTTGVLAFGSSITATIRGSSFLNNRAGPQLILVQQANVKVKDTVFNRISARTGAATLATDQAFIQFRNSSFSHHYTDGRGGVIASSWNATVEISNSMFHNNSAFGAGCIRSSDSSFLIIDSSSFYKCSARTVAGGAVSVESYAALSVTSSNFSYGSATYGGAVGVYNFSTASIIDSAFIENSGEYAGGAIVAIEYSQVNISNSLFQKDSASYGGALAAMQEAQVFVDDTTFKSNNASQSGGALHLQLLQSGKLMVWSSVFADNTAAFAGGAMYAMDNSTGLIRESQFRNNRATSGGCMCLEFNSSILVRHSNMTGNAAINGGNGGALYTGGQAQASMTDCILSNNNADNAGGAVYVAFKTEFITSRTVFADNSAEYGGAINVNAEANCVVNGSMFQSNSANYGGVLTGYNKANVTLLGNSFLSNAANQEGGVMYATNSTKIFVEESLMVKNTAVLAGGVLSATDASNITIIKSNMTQNQAGSGGGAVALFMASNLLMKSSVVTMGNSGQGGAAFCQDNSSMTLQNTRVMLNNASAGGGLAAGWSCRLVIQDSTVRNNSADNGGGVASDRNATLIVRGASYIERNVAREYGGGVFIGSPNFTPDTIKTFVRNNTGKSGDDVYAEPVNMTVVSNASFEDYVSRPGSDTVSLLPVHIKITGHKSWPVEATSVQCYLVHEPFDDLLFLGMNSSSSTGDVFFNLRVRQAPGSYVVSCLMLGQETLSEVNITLTVRSCIRGEITPSTDSCQVCQLGYYSFNPTDAQCRACPVGLATCPGGSILLPEPGTWRSTANSTQVHRCPNPAACVPVSIDALIACDASPQCREAANFSNLQCSAGYQGNLCGVCAPGYGVVKPYTCRPCMPKATIIALYVVAAVVMLVFMKVLVSLTLAANKESLESQEPCLLPSDLLRPLILYSQYILVIGSMSIDFPVTMTVPLRALAWFWSSASPETLSIDCLLSSSATLPMATQRVLFYLGMPLAMLVLLLCLEVVALMWQKSGIKAGITNRLYSSVLVAAFFFLPSVVRTIFSMFACVAIDEPATGVPYTAAAVGSYWALDLDAQCWTGYHKDWSFGLGLPLLLLVCVGMPAGILYTTLANKHRMYDPDYAMHFGFLYRAYKPSYCYWEACVVTQTQVLVAISVFGTTLGPLYQGLLMNAAVAITGFMLLSVKPFLHVDAYHVNLHSVCCLILTSYIALSFLPYGPVKAGHVYGMVMGCFVLLVNLWFILSVLYKLYKGVDWEQLVGAVMQSMRQLVDKVLNSSVVLAMCGNRPMNGIKSGARQRVYSTV